MPSSLSASTCAPSTALAAARVHDGVPQPAPRSAGARLHAALRTGSIARWLADRVGPSGEVVATDISTRHLGGLDLPNVEIREHDILTDRLPYGYFDLIHARLLVEPWAPLRLIACS
jgi:hypothetical protein